MEPSMILALALLACGKDDPVETDAVDLPSPYVYDEVEPPAPTYTLEQIASGLQVAIEVAATLDPMPAFAAYDAAMSGQSSACPRWYEDGDATFWYDECTSDAGTGFSGYAYTILYDQVLDPENGFVFDGRALFAAATIETGAGRTFGGAGTVYSLVGNRPGDGFVETYDQVLVQGSFAWDGAEAEGTWIADGLSPDLNVLRYSNSAYEGVYTGVSGGVSPLAGDMVAVAFDEVTLFPATLGSSCELEPAGTMSVRGEDGSWYDVLFDGPTDLEPETPADLCDGCGQVFYQGEPMGEACADFSALLVAR